jgi:L-lactate dehydrogenase complex protein LldG
MKGNTLATSNPSREAILARIRAGLRTPIAPIETKTFDGPIFEPILNPLERFEQECKANLMEFHLTADTAGSAKVMSQVCASLPAGEIFVQDNPVLRRLMQGAGASQSIRWSSEGRPAESSKATVTLAEALVAQTGSIFVTSACGGRGATVVAPVHIVYATTSQLVPDLVTALRNATAEGKMEKNSYGCMISGSSRTADIEKILVQGAHGPMRLVMLLEKNT